MSCPHSCMSCRQGGVQMTPSEPGHVPLVNKQDLQTGEDIVVGNDAVFTKH